MGSVAIIVADETVRDSLCSLFSKYDEFVFQPFHSLRDFIDFDNNTYWSGFIIDFRTMMKSDPDHRVQFLSLCDVFPFMRIRLESSGNMTGTIGGKNYSGEQLEEVFFESMLPSFPARKVRSAVRKKFVFNVEIIDGDDSIKTNTINICKNGFFIISPENELSVGKEIKLRVHEFLDDTPIGGKVSWLHSWGTDRRISGFGFEITDISESQKKQIVSEVW